MTYPQTPYGYDFNYYQPPTDLLSAARRAGVLMYVLGGLMILCGVGCGGTGALIPWDQFLAQQQALLAQTPALTPDVFKWLMVIMGVISLFVGVIMIVLGYFVYRGSMGGIITAIVLTSICLLLMLLNALASIPQAMAMGSVHLLMGACMMFIPLALFVLLLIWLIQAVRAASQAKLVQQQAYWQYQYQQPQDPYGHPGYGQVAQVPPPPPGQSPVVPPPPPGE